MPRLSVGPVVVVAAIATGLAVPPGAAAGPAIAIEKQNAFVKSHCAVCHNDRANNGGLSLDGFDAATAAPSLAAMMLSKLTSGTALATVHAAERDAAAAARVAKGLKTGAAGAAGVGVPDKETVDGLVAAFAAQSAGATNWSVERSKDRATGADIVTASIARELPSTAEAGRQEAEAALYRLVLTCNLGARTGAMQLAWSPEAKRGTLAVALDGGPPATFTVDGTERMGNGTSVTTGPAAFVFARFGASASRIELPGRTLTASHLFAGETVTFPFDQLTAAARDALSTCFG